MFDEPRGGIDMSKDPEALKIIEEIEGIEEDIKFLAERKEELKNSIAYFTAIIMVGCKRRSMCIVNMYLREHERICRPS